MNTLIVLGMDFFEGISGNKNYNNNVSARPLVAQKSMRDVADMINSDERTTRRLIKLNDLILLLQSLVSSSNLTQSPLLVNLKC